MLRAAAPELLYIHSERLGILNAGDLRLLDVERGLWQRLTRDLWVFDLASTRADHLLFAAGVSPRAAPQIYRYDLLSGDLQRITSLEQNHLAPAWTPDGTGVSFIAARDQGFSMAIHRLSLSPDGHAVADSTRILTPEYRVIGDYAWSPDGAWIAYTALEHNQINLYIADQNGASVREIATDLGDFAEVLWQPDSLHVIYGRLIIAQVDIQRINIHTGIVTALTATPDNEHFVTLGAAGGRIAYVVNSVWSAEHELFTRDLHSGEQRPLTDIEGLLLMPVAWSPDGAWIAFTRLRRAGGQLYRVDVGRGAVQQITFGAGYDFNPVWRR